MNRRQRATSLCAKAAAAVKKRSRIADAGRRAELSRAHADADVDAKGAGTLAEEPSGCSTANSSTPDCLFVAPTGPEACGP